MSHGFGGEEGLKNAALRGRVHAGAGVLHHEDQIFGHGQAQAFAVIAVWCEAKGLEFDLAALFAQRLHGVVAKIEQGLLHLRGVCHQRGQIAGGFMHLQLNGGGQRYAQQAGGVFHDFAHLHGAALGLVVAAEGQNLAHQIAGAAPGFFDLAQAFLRSGVVQAVGLGQCHIAQNGAHDIVEVMGNAPGHGAHGLHFVGLTQLVFQRAALGFGTLAAGQVAGKDGGGVAIAVMLEGDADFDWNLQPVGGQACHFTEYGLRGQRRKGQRTRGIGQELLQRLAQRIAGRAQKQGRRRGVEDRDALAAVQADDGIQRGIDD